MLGSFLDVCPLKTLHQNWCRTVPSLCTHNANEIAGSSVGNGGSIGALVVGCGERERFELSTGLFPPGTRSRAVEFMMRRLGLAFAIGGLPKLLELSGLLAISNPKLVGSALDGIGGSRELSWGI